MDAGKILCVLANRFSIQMANDREAHGDANLIDLHQHSQAVPNAWRRILIDTGPVNNNLNVLGNCLKSLTQVPLPQEKTIIAAPVVPSLDEFQVNVVNRGSLHSELTRVAPGYAHRYRPYRERPRTLFVYDPCQLIQSMDSRPNVQVHIRLSPRSATYPNTAASSIMENTDVLGVPQQ